MVVTCKNQILADKVLVADSFLTRLKGLMGKKSLAPGEGLLLMNCPSIHCFFMRITIDAVYLSRDMMVLGVETLSPWKIGANVEKTGHVLELAEGTAHVSVGELLKFTV